MSSPLFSLSFAHPAFLLDGAIWMRSGSELYSASNLAYANVFQSIQGTENSHLMHEDAPRSARALASVHHTASRHACTLLLLVVSLPDVFLHSLPRRRPLETGHGEARVQAADERRFADDRLGRGGIYSCSITGLEAKQQPSGMERRLIKPSFSISPIRKLLFFPLGGLGARLRQRQ